MSVEPVADRMLYSRDEAAAQLGVGLSQMNELVSRGEIESFKIGRLRKIPRDALLSYIERQRTVRA